ncbi:hypothetical protein NL676_030415 [Syzygium grande]|nr:hypothetical protein NL676_030415 [Syzygium grande]
MAGYNKQGKNYNTKISSPSFSFSNLFRPRRSAAARRVDDARDDAVAPRKIWTSDYDKGRYVAEPGIDRKATAFIDKVHESHFVEYERLTIAAV